MKVLLYFLLLPYAGIVVAQDSTRILIKADQLISDVLTTKRIYQYPEFSQGKIFFRDQTFMNVKMNYNYLNGEIEFIKSVVGEGTDTLAIGYDQMLNIQRIVLNADTFFYYDKGYLQEVFQASVGKVLQQKTLVVLRRDKLGAYGQASTGSRSESIEYFKDYFGSTGVTSVKAPENITLGYVSKLFVGDKYFTFLPANKKNILKLFSKKSDVINKYLKENDVDFRNAGHLEKLFLSLE